MKRFRFRLAALQPVRALAEDRAQLVLAGQLGALGQLREAETAQADRVAQLGGDAGTPTTVLAGDLARGRAAYDAAAQRLRGLRSSVLEQESAVQAARAELAEAARRREALDRLEQQARERHRLEQEAAERAQLDDVAVTRHGR